MTLTKLVQLTSFLNRFMEVDASDDSPFLTETLSSFSDDQAQAIKDELNSFMSAAVLPLDEIGSESNRWFGDSDEAKEWLSTLESALKRKLSSESSSKTLDSNGAELSEGDSVTVIKDLKVKGGNSDLKRGTLIRKIHLIGDPDNIECRVDGSTLVLKTMFLRKA